MQLFKESLNCKYFFDNYASTVMNWKNKMAGKSGRGKPLDFSDEDYKAINKGLKVLHKDLVATAKQKKEEKQ